MLERRSAARSRIDEVGLITIDEHTSIPCIVYDLSTTGVRLTLPDTSTVPETFLLHAECCGGPQWCMVTWRGDEMIGAMLHRPAR